MGLGGRVRDRVRVMGVGVAPGEDGEALGLD